MAGILRNLWKIIRNAEDEVAVRPDDGTRPGDEERRAVQRFAGPVPATISAGLSSFPETVTLRDLNEKGFYVLSLSPFPRGATMEMVTELPAELSMYGKRRVHYTASVVRCEENVEDGKYGIAAIIKKCEVLPLREGAMTATGSESVASSNTQAEETKETAEKQIRMADSARVGD